MKEGNKMKCPNCRKEMKNVMHFENGKNFAFHECRSCNIKTHQKRIHFDEIERGDDNKNPGNSKRVQIKR